MKKVIITMIIVGTSLQFLHAGVFSRIKGMNMPEKKVVAYTIDTSGENPRVYEFHTVDNHTCVVVFHPSSERLAMDCF